MADLPSQFGFGLVTGGFALAVGDRDDPGREPDALAATGSVLFRPQASRIVIPGERVITPQQIECKLDAEGYLYLESSVTTDPETGLPPAVIPVEERGVHLVANDTIDATPQDWTYEVTVSLTGQSQWRFPIAVTTGSEQDISALVPVDSSGGTPIIRGPKGEDGLMASIVAGDGITVDDTDPANPVVSVRGTGVRNISDNLSSGWTGTVTVARVGPIVTLQWQGLGNPGGGQTPLTIPPGFRPSGTQDRPATLNNSVGGAIFGALRLAGGTGSWYFGTGSANSVNGASGSSTYQTTDPFPA